MNHIDANNDTIALQATGINQGFLWHATIADLVPSWVDPGTSVVLELDLEHLPNAQGGESNILDEVRAAGSLDLYVQDDTSVDYAQLNVSHCVTEDCNDNGLDDSCEATGSFTCDASQTVDLKPGECCAELTVSAYLDGICRHANMIITNDFDPSQDDQITACFPAGTTNILFTLITPEGSTQYCTATVEVRDVTAPQISFCPRMP